MASIQIHRPWSFFAATKMFSVFINDEEKGKLSCKSNAFYQLEPGVYKIDIRFVWCKSQHLEIEIKEGSEIILQVIPSPFYLAWYHCLFKPECLLLLTEKQQIS